MVSEEHVHGVHAVRYAMRGAVSGGRLFVQRGVAGERSVLRGLREEADRLGVPVSVADKAELTRLAGVASHQGVVLRRPAAPRAPDWDTLTRSLPRSEALLLVLDSVQDPRNLGACLRTAAAAGARAVIAPSRRSAPLSDTARKAASGAAELLPLLRVTNLSAALRRLKEEGFWLIGLDASAQRDVYDPALEMTGRIAFVAGAEGRGLRRLTREHCDFLARVPMETDGVGSLNVSVAVGIALFEARRRARI